MYEQFRDELIVKLANLDATTLKMVIRATDIVASKYKITRECTDLVVYESGLPEVCKAYLVSRSIEGLSNKTIILYKTILTRFFMTLSKPLDKISPNDLRLWIYNYERANNISKRTMELYREIINGFFTWAVSEEWLQTNPCLKIKPIKYTKKPRKPMAQIDLEYIRKACHTKQEIAIVELLYSTGCRVSELSILKKSDINFETKEITLFGKGDKYRTAYLNAKAVVALIEYFNSRKDDSEYVIVSTRAPHNNIGKGGLEKIVKNISERVKDKIGVPVTPHIFRHTTATTALQNGMPVQDVQRMLGHANINTTMVYAEVSQSEVKTMHERCVV